MSYYCLTCKGSGERDMRGNLDCHEPGCNAATERAALELHLLALGRLHERDKVWEAYKLGQAKVQAYSSAPIKFADTDSARQYLDDWHHENFPTDRTFSRYIKGELAGDFSWQLAHAIAALEAKSKGGNLAAMACQTCGGSRVDPGGLPACRDCMPVAAPTNNSTESTNE